MWFMEIWHKETKEAQRNVKKVALHRRGRRAVTARSATFQAISLIYSANTRFSPEQRTEALLHPVVVTLDSRKGKWAGGSKKK